VNSKPAPVFLLVLAFALSAPAAEPAPGRYAAVSASPDGIGKVYAGREIARVMSFHGAEWLERPERAEEERPELLLSVLELEPGMKVGRRRRGHGLLLLAHGAARGRGRDGVRRGHPARDDQAPRRADVAARRRQRESGARHADRSGSASAGIDLALMVDVYHELEYPHEMLAAIVRALKPGGRLVFVEFKSGDASVPIKPLHTMTEAQVRKEAGVHALQWVKTARDLPWQNAVVFRKPSGN